MVVPTNWLGKDVTLAVESVDNAHEAWFNGARIGGAGRFPPDYQNGVEAANRYVVPPEAIRFGNSNLVAIRVYDHEGKGGFNGAAPQLGTDRQHISFEGRWQFRTGDDLNWAADTTATPIQMETTFSSLRTVRVYAGQPDTRCRNAATRSLQPTQRRRSRCRMISSSSRCWPNRSCAQPVFLNFDERGRMWVVQYLQYPDPPG